MVKAQFRSFKVESRGLDGARRLLREKGCEHYLDMALRYTGEDEEEEDDDDDDDDDEGGEEGGEGEEAEEGHANGGAMEED